MLKSYNEINYLVLIDKDADVCKWSSEVGAKLCIIEIYTWFSWSLALQHFGDIIMILMSLNLL